jgi:hypothetical protein
MYVLPLAKSMGHPAAANAQARHVSEAAAAGAHMKLCILQMIVNEPVPPQLNAPGGKAGWHKPSPYKLDIPQDTHRMQLLPTWAETLGLNAQYRKALNSTTAMLLIIVTPSGASFDAA